jgi:beta-lactamase class A
LQGGDDTTDLLERWRESERRSRARRSAAPPPAGARAVVLALAVVAVAYGVASREPDADVRPRAGSGTVLTGLSGQVRVGGAVASSAAVPSASALRNAWSFARRRGGQVSLAVVDTRGRLRGRDAGRRYVSASVVKALLLAAELRRLRRDGLPLDAGTRELLKAMITRSDNKSADAIYERVRDAGLVEVARSAGMRRFTVAGYWANAQVTAADLARLFSRLRRLLPRPHRRTALGLMASVVREQRWGVPRAAAGRWTAYVKGGWRATGRGELVHQAAWLRDGSRHLAVAILTDAQPSRIYAIHTVRGVADRLLAGATR